MVLSLKREMVLDLLISYLFSITALIWWIPVLILISAPIFIYGLIKFLRKEGEQTLEEAKILVREYKILIDTHLLKNIKKLLLTTKEGPRQVFNLFEGEIYKRIIWYVRLELKNHIKKGDRVLDVGTGQGYLASEIQKRLGAKVTCVDVVNYSKVDLPVVLFDGINLPFANNSFDVGFLSFVLHHTGVNQIKLLKEAKRVCKNKIIIYEDEAVGGVGALFTAFHGPAFSLLNKVNNGRDCVFHNKRQWLEIFKKLGLKVKVGKSDWTIGAIAMPVKQLFFVLSTS